MAGPAIWVVGVGRSFVTQLEGVSRFYRARPRLVQVGRGRCLNTSRAA